MVMTEKDIYKAWEKSPDESYEEFKKRFGKFYKKTLDNEYKKDERNIEKIMKYRAWDQMPGESRKEFKRRLKSEKRRTNIF